MATEMNGQFTPAPPPAAGPSTGVFSLQQETAAIAALQRAGMAPEHIQKALAESTDEAPRREPRGDDRSGELRPEQAAKMAEALLKAGVDPAKVRDALDADGFREPSGQEHSPAEYQIDWRRIAAGADPAGVAEVNTILTAGVAELAMPPGIGKAVAERAVEIGQQVAKMSPPDKAVWERSQMAQLRQHFGSDEAVVGAADMIENLEQAGPAAKRLLSIMQLNNSAWDAWAFVTLHNFARHLAEARSVKK